MQLILDKISPQLDLPRLARPRLLNLLQRSMKSGTGTIVSGRAGTGKTALATDCARIGERAVAWYKVDAADGELRVFFDYLFASIRRQRPDFRIQAIKALAERATLADIPHFTDRFVFELIQGGADPLLVVIEDLHLACDCEWLVPFLGRLLPLIPRDVHLLITSRTLPPAPLWRMRSKQTLAVIDEELLAFTNEEAVRLFETYGLSRDDARLAFERTNGRAAALTEYAVALSKAQLAATATLLARSGKAGRIQLNEQE